jgi:hypothetical protein
MNLGVHVKKAWKEGGSAMTTEHSDAGRLLDRRKFLKAAAALAAFAAAGAAAMPAVAEGDSHNQNSDKKLRDLRQAVRDFVEITNELGRLIQRTVAPFFKREQLNNIEESILFLLNALVTAALEVSGLKNRDLIKELHERTKKDLKDLFDELKKPLVIGGGGGTGGGTGGHIG